MNTQKLKTNWLKTMAAAFVAAAMAMGAHGAEKITVDKVANHYPWDGKVDCVTTLSGVEITPTNKYEGVFTLSVNKGGEDISKTVTNDFASADGTYTNTFDCTTLFGAGLYPNGGISVDLVKSLGGVQLWKDGPYWAECNVGATKPEEYGYYFWWGDTKAYVRNSNNNGWASVKDGSSFTFTTANCATYQKDYNALLNAGYIDSTTGNLVAKCDAATEYWGDQWRMPTDAEIQALIDNCKWSWTKNWNGTGVKGYVVTGKKEGYTGNSIFLPAAGYGDKISIYSSGSFGGYWSSTPNLNYTQEAWTLSLWSNSVDKEDDYRNSGLSVRPLRTR